MNGQLVSNHVLANKNGLNLILISFLQDWAKLGVKSVQVLSPAFSADCLETLEELAIQNAELFQQAGGGSYAYIPALNSDQAHIDLLAGLVQANLDALTHTLAHR